MSIFKMTTNKTKQKLKMLCAGVAAAAFALIVAPIVAPLIPFSGALVTAVMATATVVAAIVGGVVGANVLYYTGYASAAIAKGIKSCVSSSTPNLTDHTPRSSVSTRVHYFEASSWRHGLERVASSYAVKRNSYGPRDEEKVSHRINQNPLVDTPLYSVLPVRQSELIGNRNVGVAVSGFRHFESKPLEDKKKPPIPSSHYHGLPQRTEKSDSSEQYLPLPSAPEY